MKKSFLSLLIIFLLMISSIASASHLSGFPGNGNPPSPPPDGQQGPPPFSQEDLKITLDKLIIDGVLNKEQATQVSKCLREQTPPPRPPEAGQPNVRHDPAEHKSPLSQLVTDGIITEEQAARIEKALFKRMPPQDHDKDSGSLASTSTAAYTQIGQTTSKSNQTYSATRQDESGIKVSNKGMLDLSNIQIITSGNSSSNENSNFYGLNAGLLAESGSTINIKDCTIITSGSGSNAVFATGSGSSINVSNLKIKTTADSSRGLDATQTGTIKATNVDIITAGDHCAALATDRGNGTVIVTGGTMSTSGKGSPGIYSTGDIKVTDATLSATGSEAAVIEGKNSITLTNTSLSGAKQWGVMLYQSFSGDAEVGTSSFKMNGGLLTAAVGPAFYITNTQAAVELTDAAILAPSGILINASIGNWGTPGSNGGTVTFTANREILAGNILCDNISSVATILKNTTTLTGAINPENTSGFTALSLDNTSTWNVTGTSYLSSLTDTDTTLANIHDNGFTIYYDPSLDANKWLKKQTYSLVDGGKLTPKKQP